MIDKTSNHRTGAPNTDSRSNVWPHHGLYMTSTKNSLGLPMAMWKLWRLAVNSGGTEPRSRLEGPPWRLHCWRDRGWGWRHHDHHHGL